MKKLFVFFVLIDLFLSIQLAKADTLFSKDLYFGLQSDSEVLKLQEFLTDESLYLGPITGNFYSLTLKAVKAFQTREGIIPAAGYFGPKTRQKANTLLSSQIGASDEQAVSETGSAPQPATTTTNSDSSALQSQILLLQRQVAELLARMNGISAKETNLPTPTSEQLPTSTPAPILELPIPTPTPEPEPTPEPGPIGTKKELDFWKEAVDLCKFVVGSDIKHQISGSPNAQLYYILVGEGLPLMKPETQVINFDPTCEKYLSLTKQEQFDLAKKAVDWEKKYESVLYGNNWSPTNSLLLWGFQPYTY